MSELEPDVERKLSAQWPAESDRMAARAVLVGYGSETTDNEVERVRLAIVKLSDGSLDRLRTMTAAAKTDYRDVLMWAEYPEESTAMWALRSDLTEAERREQEAIRARDRTQYDEWRKK